ncbi:MAG: hypothetical protein R3C11_15715 [Planctomycetaceae bacterium]
MNHKGSNNVLKTRYVPFFAIILLVVLRVAIGWQFLYEGMWKLSTQSTSQPWTSAGFLRNSEGPFRNLFREMTGDADELSWLDEDKVNARWTAWQKRFVNHYGLSEAQQKQIDVLLNGVKLYKSDPNRFPVAELPPKVAEFLSDEKNKGWEKIFRFNAEQQLLEVDGTEHLTPAEKAKLLWLADLEVKDPLPLNPDAFKYEVIVISPDGEKIEQEKKLNRPKFRSLSQTHWIMSTIVRLVSDSVKD